MMIKEDILFSLILAPISWGSEGFSPDSIGIKEAAQIPCPLLFLSVSRQ
jgi:hypothetical protein